MLLVVALAFADPVYGPPAPPPDAVPVSEPPRADLAARMCEPRAETPVWTEPPALHTTGQVLTTTLCIAAFFTGHICHGRGSGHLSPEIPERAYPCGRPADLPPDE